MIFGATGSLNEIDLLELQKLHEMVIAKNDFLPSALVLKLAELTGKINNEIAVYITRKGEVTDVIVGDHSTVSIPEITKYRGQNLLSGVRCIHTHTSPDGRLSPQDIQSLISFRLDGMVSVGTNYGKYTNMMAAIPTIGNNFTIDKADLFGPFKLGEKNFGIVFKLIEEIDTCLRTNPVNSTIEIDDEKAVLVGLNISSGNNDRGAFTAQALYELELIAKSAGAQVLENLILNTDIPDEAYYIDKKKAVEITMLCQLLGANMVIFEGDLSGDQIRNLEKELQLKVLDRTSIILDIFAKRATSRESKIRVELAQLEYLFKRTSDMGLHLPEFNRGIGTRGPSNKKLEIDKKSIRNRIRALAEDLEDVKKKWTGPKENRRKLPAATLVGHINSGKSSIIECLCSSDTPTEDKNLSSLSSPSHKVSLPNGEQITLVDTVGFIKDLPPELLDAFKSTLEDIPYSDIIIHVVDSSSKDIYSNMFEVNNIINDLGASDKPCIVVFTKTDISSENKRYPFSRAIQNYIEISAKQRTGIDKLLYLITKMLFLKPFKAEFFVPYHESWVLPFFNENAKVIKEDSQTDGTIIEAYVTPHVYDQVKQFAAPGKKDS